MGVMMDYVPLVICTLSKTALPPVELSTLITVVPAFAEHAKPNKA